MVVVLSIHMSRHPSRHPSIQVPYPGKKDDAKGGRQRRMVAVVVYRNVYVTFHWLKSVATNFWPEFSPS
jgi:hypothetical protein